jgi:hypothetical protein
VNREREPLALMTPEQRQAYCAWLIRFVGRRHGTLPDFLRKSATELSGRFM